MRYPVPVAEVSLLLLALLLACGEPTESGPTAMVGTVSGPDGAPIGGLQVQSLETSVRTDEAGRFAVPYKDPDQHVSFTIGSTFYRRVYLPADEGTIVAIDLPETRDVSLDCGEQACDPTLVWPLADGFEARASARCAPGRKIALADVPVGAPEVQCRGAAEAPTLVDRGDALVLAPPPRALRVEVRSTGGTAPDSCEVRVGVLAARPAGEGFWVGHIAQRELVTATCDGRPARPAVVGPDAGTVALEWSAHGPQLDLEDVASWAHTVTLEAVAAEDGGWTLRLGPTAEGVVPLPPLGAGTYRVRIDGDAPSGAEPVDIDGEPGVLVLRRLEGGETLVGRLELTADLLEGTVPVDAR